MGRKPQPLYRAFWGVEKMHDFTGTRREIVRRLQRAGVHTWGDSLQVFPLDNLDTPVWPFDHVETMEMNGTLSQCWEHQLSGFCRKALQAGQLCYMCNDRRRTISRTTEGGGVEHFGPAPDAIQAQRIINEEMRKAIL